MKEPFVIINILNWNQLDTTLECLDSLKDLNYQNYLVILIDNGSTDGSLQIIKEKYPKVVLIENPENLGCCEGRNVGIRFSLTKNPDFIFLLDNDTIVNRDILKEFVNVASLDSKIGLVTPKVYYYTERSKIWTAGGASIDWRKGVFYSHGRGEIDKGQFEANWRVETVPEGFSFVRSEVFNKIGLFDPKYFFYYEGADWSSKLLKTDYKIVYASGAKIWHKYSFSQGSESPAFFYYRTRNKLLFMRTNVSTLKFLIFLIYFSYDFLVRYIYCLFMSRKRKELRACFLGILDFYRNRFGRRDFDKIDKALSTSLLKHLAKKIYAFVCESLERLRQKISSFLKLLFNRPLNLLVRLEWNLGDEIMTIPIYRGLKEKCPKSFIAAKVNYPELLLNSPYVDGINTKDMKFDKVFDIQSEDISEKRLDFLSRILAININDYHPHIYISKEETKDLKHFEDIIEKSPKFAISTGAKWRCKRWPLERFQDLCLRLERDYNAQIIEVGKGTEVVGVGKSLVDKTNLREAMVLLSLCDIFIGLDSGLLHLALAVGIPSVGLFGPVEPYSLYQPSKDFIPICATTTCFGCWTKGIMVTAGACPKGIPDCAQSISVNRVIETVDSLLKKRSQTEKKMSFV